MVDPSGRRAGLQAVVAALVLVPVSVLPAVVRLAGTGYFACGACCWAWRSWPAPSSFARRLDERSARLLLRASLVYLPADAAVAVCVGPSADVDKRCWLFGLMRATDVTDY